MTKFRLTICALLALVLFATTGVAADLTDSLKVGKADLKSVGVLAFGPDGVLFAGDSMGGQIFAIDTQDRTASTASAVEVMGLTGKIAALLGTTADQITLNDIAVNPASKKTYVSVSRGIGVNNSPVIVRIDTAGKIEALSLDNVSTPVRCCRIQ
jgi:acetyl esterase/lipase